MMPPTPWRSILVVIARRLSEVSRRSPISSPTCGRVWVVKALTPGRASARTPFRLSLVRSAARRWRGRGGGACGARPVRGGQAVQILRRLLGGAEGDAKVADEGLAFVVHQP